MLCYFKFKNFKSYRDETILDMRATNIEELSDCLIPAVCERVPSLLPLAAIYGPNAGGKSNAIHALSYLISRVQMPIRASVNFRNPFGMLLTKYTPFLFDEDSKNLPTEFEISFRTQGGEYLYQLAISADTVLSESLSYTKIPCERRRSKLLFQRTAQNITLGPSLKKANASQVNANIPYLSFLAINYSFPEISAAIQWFQESCIINYSAFDLDHQFSSFLDDSEIKPAVLDLLSSMDIPIADYEVQEDESQGEGEHSAQIFTLHQIEGQTYRLNLVNESEGTIKILSALPAVLTSLVTGSLLLVDELDAKLHPQLLRFLVALYQSPHMNINHAQLIFTCHDLSIMKSEFLRRDEIWFAARNERSSSELWCLYDLKDERGERVKPTAAYDKQYLAGRYGADPYLRQMLDWRVPDGRKTQAP